MVSRETRLFRPNKRKHPGTTAAQLKAIQERRKQAFEMRVAGATLQDIVNMGIGYKSQSHVSQDLKKARSNFYQEDIESLLVMDLARIDEMQKICTLKMRRDLDTSEVRNIMALMQFRRETMGYKPEDIVDRRASAGSVTNNGIMVVQGTTRDFLQGLMEATGASPEIISQEFGEIEKSGNTGADARVIQGEVEKSGTGNTEPKKKAGQKKSGVKLKRVKRVKRTGEPTMPPAQHGPGAVSRPAQAPVSRAQAVRASGVALGDSILLGELVEARARQLEHDIEEMTRQSLGNLDDPAVVPRELAVDLAAESAVKELEVPIKLRDNNVPVSSGISYKIPPRKPTPEEGAREVTRRLKKPSTANVTVDRVRTRVHEEEI